MRFTKVTTGIAVAAALMILVSGCTKGDVQDPAKDTGSTQKGNEAKVPDTITLATSALKAPASFIQDGEIVGMEPSIVKEVGKRLGAKVKVVKTEFDALIPSLQSGRADVGASNLNVTKKREKTVDMLAYLTSWSSFLVPADKVNEYHTLTDFCGKQIGLFHGAPQEAYITGEFAQLCKSKGLKPPTPHATSDPSTLPVMIKSGQADALAESTTTAHSNVDAKPDVFGVPDSIKFLKGYVGFAFPKDSPLTKPFQKAFDDMIKDGAYKKLTEKWDVEKFAIDGTPAPLNP